MRKLRSLLTFIFIAFFLLPADLEARPKRKKSKHHKKSVHHFKKKKKKKKHSKATACPSFHKGGGVRW